jgi:hypothetical protein
MSLLFFFSESPIKASLGSQGFLSIPIYRNHNRNEVKIIRLHIWSTSFSGLVDHMHSEHFSIHSHLFHAESHIICGTVYNNRYVTSEIKNDCNKSIYEICWNEVLNDRSDNSLKSELANTKRSVCLSTGPKEKFDKGSNYVIKAGDFHKSGFDENQDIAATILVFDSKKGRTESSQVIGPYEMGKAPELKYPEVEISGLLNKIDKKISHG